MTQILAAVVLVLAIGMTVTILYLSSEVRYQRRHISSLEQSNHEWQQAFYHLRDDQQQATADAHWLDQLEQHANGGEDR